MELESPCGSTSVCADTSWTGHAQGTSPYLRSSRHKVAPVQHITSHHKGVPQGCACAPECVAAFALQPPAPGLVNPMRHRPLPHQPLPAFVPWDLRRVGLLHGTVALACKANAHAALSRLVSDRGRGSHTPACVLDERMRGHAHACMCSYMCGCACMHVHATVHKRDKCGCTSGLMH